MITGLNTSGGEGGIRTLDTGVSPYNGLANRRLQPLGHLSGVRNYSLPRAERWFGPCFSLLITSVCLHRCAKFGVHHSGVAALALCSMFLAYD